VGVVGVVTEVAGALERLLLAEPAPQGDALTPEVHEAVALVGVAGGEQRRGELGDVCDVQAGVRGVVRGPVAERLHVALEQELLGERELVVGPAVLERGSREHVVDVGDVSAGLGRDAGQTGNALEHVGPHERGGVPEVGDQVGRDPADVDPRGRGQGQAPPGQDQVACVQRLGVHERDPSR